MQLTHPVWLWVLGLIPLIILIHSLKPKPQHVAVTDFFLWRHALQESRSGLSLSKILSRLSLLLQLLVVILAALALARPVWRQMIRPADHAIIILDGSASMQTRTDKGLRFDAARSRALAIVDGLPDGGQALLVQSGPRPLVLCPFTDDRRRLRRTISAAQPFDTAGGLAQALHLALAFYDPARNDQVYLITDGAGGEAPELFALHPRVTPVLVGGGERNVGITGFAARPEPAGGQRYQVLASIKNYQSHALLCPLRVTLDGRLIHQETIGLDAGQQLIHIFSYDGPLAGKAIARLDLEDDFAVDDAAYMALQPSRKLWVLLVGPGNFFLEKALAAFPDVMVNSMAQIVSSSWADQTLRNDIVILDRVTAPAGARGNFLLIDALSPSLPLTGEQRLLEPQIVDWDRASLLMKGVDLQGVYIADARQVSAAGGAHLVAAAAGGSGLIYTYEDKALRMVYLGFDPTRSDLPLRVAFPVLIGNVLEWLVPQRLRFEVNQVKTGEPFVLRPAPGAHALAVRNPAGKWDTFDAGQGWLPYDQTQFSGFYTIAEGERSYAFGVNLADADESDIRAADPLQTPVPAEAPGGAEIPVTADVWPWLLIAVLLTAAVEWGLWVKGRG